MAEELYTLSKTALNEMLEEIRLLKRRVSGGPIPARRVQSTDAPYPAVAQEDIAAGSEGSCLRQITAGTTWSGASEGPQDVYCFNAVTDGDIVNVYRDKSNGRLYAIPVAAGDSTFEQCFCQLLDLVARLAEINDNLDDVYEAGATEEDPDITIQERIQQIAVCGGCGVECGDCVLPMILQFSLESVDDISGLDHSSFSVTDCYDFAASSLNDLKIPVPNEEIYGGLTWSTEHDVSDLVTPFVRFGSPDDGHYSDFRLFIRIVCNGSGDYNVTVTLRYYSDGGALEEEVVLTPYLGVDSDAFETVPIDEETCESEDNTTSWGYNTFTEGAGSSSYKSQSVRFNVNND